LENPKERDDLEDQCIHGRIIKVHFIQSDLREEHRPRVFENRVLRRIFGPEREEDRSWRKLHNDELHNLYSSPNIVRVIKVRRLRWVRHLARMGKGERCLQGFGWEA
jgi:hypothetical protein